jgi:hypothetical protein
MNSEDLVGNGKQLKALPFDLLQKNACLGIMQEITIALLSFVPKTSNMSVSSGQQFNTVKNTLATSL